MSTVPPVTVLIARWQQLRAQGETPSLHEVCADCPERVEELKEHLGEAYKRRGTIPPAAGRLWTPKEDALILMMPTAEAAKNTRRTIFAVESRRRVLRGRR